jgi:hypothetical protein
MCRRQVTHAISLRATQRWRSRPSGCASAALQYRRRIHAFVAALLYRPWCALGMPLLGAGGGLKNSALGGHSTAHRRKGCHRRT